MTELLRNTPQTLAYEPLDSQHILACPRVPVAKIEAQLRKQKPHWFTKMAENGDLQECCRSLHLHDIEAWFSCEADKNKGIPDIYKVYCKSCERTHAFFCVGGNHPLAKKHSVTARPELYDLRPFWR